jgi:phenylacetate-CoA ligase
MISPTKKTREKRVAIKPTSLSKELEIQKKWKLRSRFAKFYQFEKLVYSEFLTEQEEHIKQCRGLSKILQFAEQRTRYYRKLFRKQKISATDITNPSQLHQIPPLTKLDILDYSKKMQAKFLPEGHSFSGFTMSSGTTGKPTVVNSTNLTRFFFCYLQQRGLRWYRLDPMATLAVIRLPSQLPLTEDGQELEIGHTLKLKNWKNVGYFFHTGPFIGFSVFNHIDKQADWLYERDPDYLVTYSETLEHLAFAFQDRKKPASLKGVLAISEQLTLQMARHAKKTFGVPVFQNYGLNEIGIVATKCREGNRYHVHTEHCLVEICDDSGKPCAPGETGKLLVTSLNNYAMPLIRYDTDDLAVAVDGPCPCGRTLPSFGEVTGRYSRIAFLPENTLGYVGAIRDALEHMPAELSRNLRQFQVHQYNDNTFELRLFAPGGIPESFTQRIVSAWRNALGGNDRKLTILEVEEIMRNPCGKFQDFTSDFYLKAE